MVRSDWTRTARTWLAVRPAPQHGGPDLRRAEGGGGQVGDRGGHGRPTPHPPSTATACAAARPSSASRIAPVGLVAHRPQRVDVEVEDRRRRPGVAAPSPHRRRGRPRRDSKRMGRGSEADWDTRSTLPAKMAHGFRFRGHLRRRLPLLLRRVDRRRPFGRRRGGDPRTARAARRAPASSMRPAATGRIARRLAVGRPRRDRGRLSRRRSSPWPRPSPVGPGGRVTYVEGDLRQLPGPGALRRRRLLVHLLRLPRRRRLPPGAGRVPPGVAARRAPC